MNIHVPILHGRALLCSGFVCLEISAEKTGSNKTLMISKGKLGCVCSKYWETEQKDEF